MLQSSEGALVTLTSIGSWEEMGKKYGYYKGKSLRPGGGGRFLRLVDTLTARGKTVAQARGIAAKVGRQKYGKKLFQYYGLLGKARARFKRLI